MQRKPPQLLFRIFSQASAWFRQGHAAFGDIEVKGVGVNVLPRNKKLSGSMENVETFQLLNVFIGDSFACEFHSYALAQQGNV
jgi:hypothetical protein